MEKQYKLPNPSNASLSFTPDGGQMTTLKFLENVQVKERGSSRLGEYKIIGRSTNLYAYTGAESRTFNLTFHLTLPVFTYEGGGGGGVSDYKAVIDLIRSSTVNAKVADSSAKGGAPSISLRYGQPWQSIKCVCDNYNISIVERAGYDVNGMTPRRIKVTMSLIETEIPTIQPGGN
tara:strand:+ start:520 stop:1047 length:528 start_codon:yes stop_codon:yes gene_type:complete